MSTKYSIAGYCRISVDEEMDRDNTSIENQKAIITDFVKRKFPDSTLEFYEDRDRSGYTFEQREGYQELRKKMLQMEYDIPTTVRTIEGFIAMNGAALDTLRDELGLAMDLDDLQYLQGYFRDDEHRDPTST